MKTYKIEETQSCKKSIRMSSGLFANPADWISIEDGIPTERCMAFTPNADLSLRHRFIPAGMFKQIATDATHWQPLTEPEDQS